MPMSRVSIGLLFTWSAMSALGHAQSPARSNRQPSIDLARIDALNRNVVAADFNGDGIIDLAASAAVPSSAGNTSSTGVRSTSNGFVAFVSSAPSTSANAGSNVSAPVNVAVFGNGVTVPNTSITTPAVNAATLRGGNVTVFGNGVTVPNMTVPASPAGSVAPVPSTGPPVAGTSALPGSVAVFGNSVSTPNAAPALAPR